MRIDILTLFPEFFDSPLHQSMLRRAQALGRVSFRVLDLRDYTLDRHKVADDRPFGGGPGMVMKPEPLVAAIRAVREEDPDTQVIFLTPTGHLFSQGQAAGAGAIFQSAAHLRSLRRGGRTGPPVH